MKLVNPIRLIALLAILVTTSSCALFATEEEVVDPVTGAITIVPVAPREAYSGGDRGTGGSGGWNP